MAIDLGNDPGGTPPTAGEKLQIRSAIGVGTTDALTVLMVNAGSGSAAVPSYGMGTTGIFSRTSVRLNFNINGTDSGVEVGPNLLALSSTANINWTSGTLPSSSPDLILQRDAAGILAQRNGSAAQTQRTYNNYTSATVFERGTFGFPTATNRLRIGTEFLGAGMAALPIDFVTGDVVRMSIGATGNVGIGTTTPASKMQVTSGDIEVETVTNGIILKAAGTSTRYRLTLNAGGTALVFTAV